MPVLKEDGTILFESAAEFLSEYRENIVNNSLMVETTAHWPLQSNRTFIIEVPPLEQGVSLAAEVLFVADGQAGLEITADVQTFQALAQLMADLLTADSARVHATTAAVPVVDPSGPGQPQQAYQPPPSRHPTRPVYLDRGGTGDAISETQTLQTVSAREPQRRRSVPAISVSGELSITDDMSNYQDSVPLGLEPDNLRRLPLPRLIATIASAQVPICLSVDSEEEGEISFHFNMRGNLVKLLGASCEEKLLERFTRDGLLNKELLREIKEMVDETRSAEEILLYRKIVKPREYWVCIREMAIGYLMAIHKGGSTSFRLKSEMVKRRTGIPFGSLIIPWMEVALRNLPGEEVDSFLEPMWFHYPYISEDSPWPLQTLDVDQRTLRFLEKALTGRDPLIHVRKTSPLGTNRTKRMFCAMMSIGLMSMSEKPTALSNEETPEAKLQSDLDRRRKATYFDQLGVHWSTHPNHFKTAVDAIKKEFGANSKWDRFYPETREICQQLIRIADDAATYLKSKSKRVEHRIEIVSTFQLQVSAFHFFQQAEIAILREAYKEARELLEMAVEMDGKKEYMALLRTI